MRDENSFSYFQTDVLTPVMSTVGLQQLHNVNKTNHHWQILLQKVQQCIQCFLFSLGEISSEFDVTVQCSENRRNKQPDDAASHVVETVCSPVFSRDAISQLNQQTHTLCLSHTCTHPAWSSALFTACYWLMPSYSQHNATTTGLNARLHNSTINNQKWCTDVQYYCHTRH